MIAVSPSISKKIGKHLRKGLRFHQESPAAISCSAAKPSKRFSSQPKPKQSDVELTLNLRLLGESSQIHSLTIRKKTKVSEILQRFARLPSQKTRTPLNFSGDLSLMLVASDKILPNEVDFAEIETKFRNSKEDQTFIFGEKDGQLQVLWPIFQVCRLNDFEENRHEPPYSSWKSL